MSFVRRQIAIAGVVIILLFGGCISWSGGSTQSSPGPPDRAWTDGEQLDTTVLIAQHFEALRTAGNFTENTSGVIRVEGAARPPADTRPEGFYPPSVTRRQVDLDGNRLLRDAGGERRESVRFLTTEVDTTRRKSCSSDACTYEYSYHQHSAEAPVPYAIKRYRDEEIAKDISHATANLPMTYAGTIDRNGETLHRYQAVRNLSHPAPPFSKPPTGKVTLLVTDDGIIRQFTLRYEGVAAISTNEETRTVRVTQTFVKRYTRVAQTQVERPEWVDRAAEDREPPMTETAPS